jgi:hypothetical protein
MAPWNRVSVVPFFDAVVCTHPPQKVGQYDCWQNMLKIWRSLNFQDIYFIFIHNEGLL